MFNLDNLVLRELLEVFNYAKLFRGYELCSSNG